MLKFIELCINAFILLPVFYFIGRILFQRKNQQSPIRMAIIIFIFAILSALINMVNSEILHGTIKIISVYSLFSLYYFIVFKETLSKTMIVSLIMYLCLCASEVLVVLVISIITDLLNLSMQFIKNNILINFLIGTLQYIIVVILKNKLILFVKNIGRNDKFSKIIIFIILITIALLEFRIPFSEWSLNIEFIVTMVILFCFCMIGLFVLKQDSEIKKTTAMYQQLVEYSDITNGLLEDYRLVSHEHKNQLSIIIGMINKNNKELINYIEELIEKRNIIKYQWIGELNHLPLSGLKGLINYKLMESEKEKINTTISISKEIIKTKIKDMTIKQKDNLYSIMGVYLDNAIQAAKDSKKKELSIEIYKDKKEIVIILANTYKGKIELSKLDTYGYTTKGKNHGVGLAIVKRITETDNTFCQKRSLFNEYFIQELRIDLTKIKK